MSLIKHVLLFLTLMMVWNAWGQSKPVAVSDTFPCNSWRTVKWKSNNTTFQKSSCKWNVLANDSDPQGDQMKVMRFNGRLVKGTDSIVMKDTGVVYLSEGGNFMVRCFPSFIGTITMTYTVNDGAFIFGIWKGKSGTPSKGTIVYRKEW